MTPFQKPAPRWWSRRRVRYAAFLIGVTIVANVASEIIYDIGIGYLLLQTFEGRAGEPEAGVGPTGGEFEGKPGRPDEVPGEPQPSDEGLTPDRQENTVSPPIPEPATGSAADLAAAKDDQREATKGEKDDRPRPAGAEESGAVVEGRSPPAAGESSRSAEELRRDPPAVSPPRRGRPAEPDPVSVLSPEPEPQEPPVETIEVTARRPELTPAVRLRTPQPRIPQGFRSLLSGKQIRFWVLVTSEGRTIVEGVEAADVPDWAVELCRAAVETTVWKPARDETGAEVDSIVPVVMKFDW
jgi:hypothetical protein